MFSADHNPAGPVLPTDPANPTIDCVLPLALPDLDRAGRLLLPSLTTNFTPLGTTYVVTPAGQAEEVRTRLGSWPNVVVLSEQQLVPALALYPRVIGWFRQQLVKLVAASMVRTPIYLTLDADVLCVHPVTYDDLVLDGKPVLQQNPLRGVLEGRPEWLAWAAWDPAADLGASPAPSRVVQSTARVSVSAVLDRLQGVFSWAR